MRKNLKTVYYQKETSFGEAYVANGTWQEIKVSELTTNRESEKLEAKFLNATRELNNTTSTGKVNGKASFTKPLDASFYNNHLELTEMAFGKLEQLIFDDPAGEVHAVASYEVVTVDDGTKFTVGDIVQIGRGTTGLATSVNEVLAISANDVTLKYAMSDDEKNAITINDDKLIKVPVFSPSETENASYCFVTVFDDNSVEVMRGAVASMSFELARDGKLDMKLDIMSADIASEDASGTALVKPLGTLTSESENDIIYVDFVQTWIHDATTGADKQICPYNFSLKINHELIAEKSLCGLNGITGYYSKADITGEIEYGRTPANLITFSKKNEANVKNHLWLSQSTLAIIAEGARFTNLDTGYTDELDNIKLNVDVNYSTTKKLLVVLPF